MDNLDLIDWRMVGFASLWILGLSLILSVLGFVDYHARGNKRRFRDELKEPGYQVGINAGLVLFCLGLIGSARAWWESVLWGLLAAAFVYYGIVAFRERKTQQEQDN